MKYTKDQVLKALDIHETSFSELIKLELAHRPEDEMFTKEDVYKIGLVVTLLGEGLSHEMVTKIIKLYAIADGRTIRPPNLRYKIADHAYIAFNMYQYEFNWDKALKEVTNEKRAYTTNSQTHH